jgi:excisionase family DNA binding protein
MRYYTSEEAANYLGVELSYLRRQIRMNAGPAHVRPSPRLALFVQDDLDQWRAGWTYSSGKTLTSEEAP